MKYLSANNAQIKSGANSYIDADRHPLVAEVCIGNAAIRAIIEENCTMAAIVHCLSDINEMARGKINREKSSAKA